MIVLIFFGVVVVFSLLLTIIDKVHSYNKSDRSIWLDGDSILVKPKDAKNVGGGFGKRLGA